MLCELAAWCVDVRKIKIRRRETRKGKRKEVVEGSKQRNTGSWRQKEEVSLRGRSRQTKISVVLWRTYHYKYISWGVILRCKTKNMLLLITHSRYVHTQSYSGWTVWASLLYVSNADKLPCLGFFFPLYTISHISHAVQCRRKERNGQTGKGKPKRNILYEKK